MFVYVFIYLNSKYNYKLFKYIYINHIFLIPLFFFLLNPILFLNLYTIYVITTYRF